MSFSDDLIARARRVRLFICDVDGVLTDATVIMGGGAETKEIGRASCRERVFVPV